MSTVATSSGWPYTVFTTTLTDLPTVTSFKDAGVRFRVNLVLEVTLRVRSSSADLIVNVIPFGSIALTVPSIWCRIVCFSPGASP